jgi:hypothetical protein
MRHELQDSLLGPRAADVSWIALGGWVAGAFAAAAGMTLLARRLSGAILASADPAVVLPAAVVGAALVLLADAGVRAGLGAGIATLARCGIAVMAASLLLPPAATTPAGWVTLTTAAAMLATVIIRRPALAPTHRPARRPPPRPLERWTADDPATTPRGRRAADAAPPAVRPRAEAAARPTSAAIRPAAAAASPADAETAAAGLVRQRLVRRETADGLESIVGELHIAVPLGAKLASGHVGFCPSFRLLPTVEVATDYDGVEAVVAVGELLPWGVRIDCRLAEPADEPLEIPVTFIARGPAEG